MSERKDFCIECRKECDYSLRKQKVKKIIKEKEYEFEITEAFCKECGMKMDIPSLIDINIKEIDEQYRKIEDIVSIDDIKKVIDIYKIGKGPLSLALGFGEITITRYLMGQVPSKEYSDVIKGVLASPKYMMGKLEENKDKIAETAYKKAYDSAKEMNDLFSVSTKMRSVISYVFNKMEEITPLALQKILYYVQGINLAINEKEMVVEECRAWEHGPVFREVYNMFRNFKYNPIEDVRFAIFENTENELDKKEKKVIDLVINTFGVYTGKTLERITHEEDPWNDARLGYEDGIPSNVLISKESMKKYFKKINKKYNIETEEGIRKYINEKLNG
ncbi:type II toxin-antitoxin system antitoxin SocA domain-containing protein [uncultured Eubacterium sp.]|uniref:type II toxin-antitoxin system antitoxin SocA domain-containing protein n=1 Tax=uncultured Eubacterium sp. TaxID=165185 RepID=UPI0025950CCE|nr:type II toxin-antitoxin system antitoxin SocA domain-containing protein [uncultured Eubacterium sp.]